MATFVVGDCHGCLKTLRHLLEAKVGIAKTDFVMLLGDLIDRGPESAQLVDYIIDLQAKGINISSIRGNHEQMFIDALSDEYGFRNWMLNGGDSTILSYKRLFGQSFSFPNDLPESHLSFFSNLPYYYIYNIFVLVHGGINCNISNPFEDTFALLWSRMESLPHSFMPDKTFVFGHTPTPLEKIKSAVKLHQHRLIPLDAGCVYAGIKSDLGYLVALDLDSLELHWVYNMG